MYLCHKKEDFLHDLIWPWPSNIIQGYVLPTLWSTVLFDWNMSQIGPKGENVCSGQEFFPLLSFTFDLETWSEKFEALIRPVDLKIELVYTVKDGNFFSPLGKIQFSRFGSLLSIMLSVTCIKPTCQRVV